MQIHIHMSLDAYNLEASMLEAGGGQHCTWASVI